MQWSDIPRDPAARTLRQFAGLCILFFGGSAIWQYVVHSRAELSIWLGVLALTLGSIGLLFPRVLKPVFVTWMMVTFPIGWLVSRVLLMFLFWGVMTPVALAWRAVGRDTLQLRRKPGATTYWTAKERPVSIESYFRQY